MFGLASCYVCVCVCVCVCVFAVVRIVCVRFSVFGVFRLCDRSWRVGIARLCSVPRLCWLIGCLVGMIRAVRIVWFARVCRVCSLCVSVLLELW